MSTPLSHRVRDRCQLCFGHSPKTILFALHCGIHFSIREVLVDESHRQGRQGQGGRGRGRGSASSSSSSSIHRILLMMGVSDILFCLAGFLGTWPAPERYSEYACGLSGNRTTCDFQGFLFQLGWVASPLFSMTLSVISLNGQLQLDQ